MFFKKRREYDIQVTINGRKVDKVIIDPHYEKKHGASVDDEVILELIRFLDGRMYDFEDEAKPFFYFCTDDLILREKRYKLIWLLEEDKSYLGVINVFRRK